ncbi:hypothetical protein MGG_15548 [Pyricularia oryzae 70-15]|uniref:Uncharacterized protein n=3 Tax=Pyricularia oryzae TaxID=318829 RepID=G4MSV8_PYRO7|nr:uncharacterized protein MGG_15548 [Pyricularia oryzae 70-15]EHA53812.1 hypothetical protein MGG_15548 [Pyricularia oryzae 70-15]ELQ37084.1 hypothetical protein OOU_Y34scaffold00619g58 [Pyricularia oryzae Y34]KAI7930802.1 hypothetical protein M0657_001542 [Pyricularia oryzae]KAI7931204.1 hypothetical protein M9X92_000490 [Pyricularia oryzae]
MNTWRVELSRQAEEKKGANWFAGNERFERGEEERVDLGEDGDWMGGAFGEDEDHFESYYVVAVAIPGIKEQGSCQVCQGFQPKVNFSKWLHGSGSGCRISSFFRSGEPR